MTMFSNFPFQIFFASTAILMWLGLLLLPWRPWATREQISAGKLPDKQHESTTSDAPELQQVSVLIPARDEASCVAQTLTALKHQGRFAQIILIDDQSEDGTKQVSENLAAQIGLENLKVIEGVNPPAGWSGKLWALHQGLDHVDSPYILLLDADIELAEMMVPTLLRKLHKEQLDSISVMASLYMGSWAEKLLLPPFIYFFKLIYPFHLANSEHSKMAAAAGGCVLMRTSKLKEIGGFAALSDAIIDDCTLAKKIKDSGGRIWLGLSRDVRAIRPYGSLENIWNMVARTAFTQLRYSIALLLICTALMLVGYAVPIFAIFAGATLAKFLGVVAFTLLSISFLPTVKFYELPLWWALTLPLAAGLFLAMTWTSAFRYMRGERSRWKNRSYAREIER